MADRIQIREFCTFNTGTAQDVGATRLGNDNWVIAYVHLAHDCQVGNQTVLANNATLAGHVHIGDWVTVGGLSGVHQFVKIGAHAFVGFASHVSQDVPPYMMVDGNPLAVRGFNIEGLRRRGFDGPTMAEHGFDAWWPHDKLAVRGYVEVLSHYREIAGIRNQLAERLLSAEPAERADAFIGVDAPDFNLDLEARLKAQGIKER